MIALSPRAQQHLEALQRHYEDLGRVEALRNLLIAVAEAADKIERDPSAGLAAPRPYPGMSKSGRAWMKAGRYWISYRTTTTPVITGIFRIQRNDVEVFACFHFSRDPRDWQRRS